MSLNKGWGCVILLLILSLSGGCNKTPQKNALVTFQFDDASVTQYTKAKPLFDSKGIKASLMVTTSNVGKSKYYMSWSQLTEMYNEGWEIGAHTVSHLNLRDAEEAAVRYELSQGKAVLEEYGFNNVHNFAYTYGYYDMDLVYLISGYYRSARTSVAQTGFYINPRNIQPYELSSYEGRFTVDNVTDAYRYVDKAQKEGRWLIFGLHEFRNNNSDDDTATKNEITDIKALEMLIEYIQNRNIPIVTTEKALDYYIGTEG